MQKRFDKLSEASGIPITDEAASMMVTRYLNAAEHARGRRTLEIACASGPGLGLLSRAASFTVGGDIDATMLERAQRHYRGRVPLVRLSADALPFRAGSFDFVALMEATYYVPDLPRALDEIARVLAPRGTVMLVSANPERADFIRSPFSHVYYTADEFHDLLTVRGFRVEIRAAFPFVQAAEGSRLKASVTGLARRALESLHLVPRTLEGRARLKRLLGARLRTVPPEIDESFGARAPLTPRPRGPIRDCKVFYVCANREAV